MSVQILLDRYFDQQALENDSKANLGQALSAMLL